MLSGGGYGGGGFGGEGRTQARYLHEALVLVRNCKILSHLRAGESSMSVSQCANDARPVVRSECSSELYPIPGGGYGGGQDYQGEGRMQGGSTTQIPHRELTPVSP